MAEKEIKEVKQAPKKAKSDKPSLFSRLAAFFKSCKAEMKKIVWSSWTTVRSNTLMVLVSIIVISAAIGIVDLLFSQGIVVLSILVK